jgi:hypothetical protein
MNSQTAKPSVSRILNARNAVCLGIVTSVFIFFILTIRAGQPWPDDFAMYVHEAQNLVRHVPLSRTGYVYDPYNPSIGPRVYPPLFPVMLTPAYAVGGLQNLGPMKIEIVMFFVGMLVVLWRWLGSELPPIYCVAFLAIVGFSPSFWNYKDLIASDIPFAFFLYLTLALADGMATGRSHSGRSIWRVCALAALIFLCFGMRTMGVVLIPSSIVLAALNWRRSGRSLLAAAGMALVPCIIQWKVFGGESSYFDQLKLGPLAFVGVVLRNVVTYSWSLAIFWNNPYSHLLRNAFFVCVSLFAVLAYFRRLRSGPTIYEIFLPAYLAIVLLWPNPDGERYLLPVFPLYVFYCLQGIEFTSQRFSVRRLEPILAAVLAIIVFSYVAEFSHADYRSFPDGMSNPETKQLFAFIRSNTAPADILVFRRARALALYTGRSASVYPDPQHASDFVNYFQGIGADYLIEAPALDDSDFDAFVEKSCPTKDLVFSNSDFRVYHITTRDLQACDVDASGSPLAQTTAP